MKIERNSCRYVKTKHELEKNKPESFCSHLEKDGKTLEFSLLPRDNKKHKSRSAAQQLCIQMRTHISYRIVVVPGFFVVRVILCYPTVALRMCDLLRISPCIHTRQSC
jgi:hypothetical protein